MRLHAQVLPAWHALMVSRRPVALNVSNCQQVPAIVAASKPRVSGHLLQSGLLQAWRGAVTVSAQRLLACHAASDPASPAMYPGPARTCEVPRAQPQTDALQLKQLAAWLVCVLMRMCGVAD